MKESIVHSNNAVFNKQWQKYKKYPLVFITSKSGTGKTTFYKWLFIRRALKYNETFDIFFRWEDDIQRKFNNDNYLSLPKHHSNRLQRLAEKVEIICDNQKYYLVEKSTQRKLARALAINTQSKVKSTENELWSYRALFDEVLADDNSYAPLECYKFARLIDTRARYRKYNVICLYNNTSPFFPYEDYFKNSGAKFVNFDCQKWGEGQEDENLSIQSVLKNSKYGSAYSNNDYEYFEEFFKDIKLLQGREIVCYMNIYGKLFKVLDFDDFVLFVKSKKVRNNRPIYTISMQNNQDILLTNSNILNVLRILFSNRQVFTNSLKLTYYIKKLAEEINLCYN